MSELGTPEFQRLMALRAQVLRQENASRPASRRQSAVPADSHLNLMRNAAAAAVIAETHKLTTDISFNRKIVAAGKFRRLWEKIWGKEYIEPETRGWVLWSNTTVYHT